MSAIIDTFVMPPYREQIIFLYQDEHLLLVNKPARLLSLSGRDPRSLDSVHHRLVQRFPGCTLVYRLGLGTSSLIAVARSKDVNALLCQQFSQCTVAKVYTVLLCGHLAEGEGIVEAAITKNPARFPRMSLCVRHGKPARSCCRVIDRLYQSRDGERALMSTQVALTPEIGHAHQLHIHCQLLNYPILDCDLYGDRELPGMEQVLRLMLRANELHFVHPVSHELVRIQQTSPFQSFAARESGLPHQIVGHLRVGIRIVFILLILTQGAVRHDATGATLGDFLDHHRRSNRISTFRFVIRRQTDDRQTATNQLGLGGLVDHDFSNQIVIDEVKVDIALDDRNTVRLDQLLHLRSILLRQCHLLLLFAELFIALQLSFFTFFHRFPGLTGLGTGFFYRSLDFGHFFVVNQAGFEHLLL